MSHRSPGSWLFRTTFLLLIAITSPPAFTACLYVTQDTTLDSDLECGDTAIQIGGIPYPPGPKTGASAVVLDCQGHTILGHGRGAGILVLYGRNITITNCIVKNFEIGIYLGNTNDSHLVKNLAQNNAFGGFRMHYSRHNLLSFNTAIDNNLQFYSRGFFLGTYSHDNVLEFNYSQGHCVGYQLNRSRSNTLLSNTARGNDDFGFFVTEASHRNFLRNNLAESNGFSGFSVAVFSNDNYLLQNDSIGNADSGFRISNGNENILEANLAERNGSRGIWIFNDARDSLIHGNIIRLNASIGIDSRPTSSLAGESENNLIFDNLLENPINAIDSGLNSWNAPKSPGPNILGGPFIGGNFWSDYAGADLDNDGIGDTDLPYDSGGRILNGGDFLPLVPPPGSGEDSSH